MAAPILAAARISALQEQIRTLQEQINRLQGLSENAMTTWTFNEYMLADAPLASDGMNNFAMAIITDGRKDGEGAGNGTGIVAMYNPSDDKWYRTSDYSEVVV